MGPFDFINNINSGGVNMMRDSENDLLSEKSYDPFLTNRALSYHVDTVLLSNLMNVNSHVDKRPQYEFYKNAVKPKKRFSKWAKPEKSDLINKLSEVYGCNKHNAEIYASLLTDEQIAIINNNNNKGGMSK